MYEPCISNHVQTPYLALENTSNKIDEVVRTTEMNSIILVFFINYILIVLYLETYLGTPNLIHCVLPVMLLLLEYQRLLFILYVACNWLIINWCYRGKFYLWCVDVFAQKWHCTSAENWSFIGTFTCVYKNMFHID